MNLLELLKPVLRPNVGHLAALAAIALVLVSLMAIDTAPTGGRVVEIKQAAFAAAGVLVMLLVAMPHYKTLNDLAYPACLFVLPLLVLVLIPGMPDSIVPVRNGARRWIDLGPVDMQPSELAKIAYILALARYLRFRENYRSIPGLMVPAIITMVPVLLINREPDLGTSLMFLPILGAMLVAAGAKLRHLIAIVIIGLVIAPPLAYPFLKPYQQTRVKTLIAQWKGETKGRDAEGFQSFRARITTGAGGVTGYGQGKDDAEKIVRYNALPESHTDMIFAVICARWGFLGAAVVIGLYLLLLGAGLAAAAVNRDPFARLVAVGVVALFFAQLFVNIGMVIGLLPVTGVTLPLLSYGGSSLLTCFAQVGLILNTATHRPVMTSRRAFEFATA